MDFLPAFLNHFRPDLAVTLLLGSRRDIPEIPPPVEGFERLAWYIGLGPQFVPPKGVHGGCANVSTSVLQWRKARVSLPELWTRWKFFPARRGEGERVPILHWQGAECKTYGGEVYHEQFVRPGIAPDLTI